MYHEPIDRDDYAQIAKEQFVADKFDAEYYADLAKRAGMKYMVFTTRHHDGFALFDSKCSHRNFTVMNTPCKRDLVKEYADACRDLGLAVGFYYSPLDWRFEGYFFPRMYRKSADAMRDQCFAQVRELMENYGKVDILWFDGGEDDWLARGYNLNKWNISYDDEESSYKKVMIPEFWGEYDMYGMVRELQPNIVVNNRYGMRRLGDYTTPEGIVGDFDAEHPWETCYTIFNDATWGWIPGKEIMSLKEIIYTLIEVVTGGGNLLFNIPPRGDGSLDPTHEARLLEVGEWMDKYGDTIYSTRCGPFKNDKKIGGFNHKDNRIYAFVKEDASPLLRIPLCAAEVREVISRSGDEIKYSVKDGVLTIDLIGNRAPIMSVLEIVLDRNVDEVYEKFDINTKVYF
jgi:alpha-L-fucosidase